MLKVILYSAESPLGSSPLLYHIRSENKDILFIESGILAPVVHYYIIQDKEPTSKWIELRRLTGEYSFVNKIGNDTKSLCIPVLQDAFNRGFYSVVVSDCVSSPYRDGHDRSLENMKNLITIINSKEIENVWLKL
jgi:Isochorismatase family